MCTNGRYTEHGIMGLDGFAAERWRCHARLLVPVPKELERVAVLVEPASVVAKAWDHIERIGARAYFAPRRVLVTGAGPIGLLAALLGVQRGLDVQVLDRVTSGVKPELCKAIGVTYHAGSVADVDVRPDIVLECTGVGSLVLDVIHKVGPSGIVCLTGVGSEGRKIPVDATALNRELVLESAVVFWSVNAGRRHYEIAVKALAAADPTWLDRLITRRVPLARWSEALAAGPDHVKTVLELGG